MANVFNDNCIKCHNPNELNKFIKAYTLKYSSEKRIKDAFYRFLRNPTSNVALMDYQFIIKRGYKKSSKLSDSELKNAVKIYYQKYNMTKMIR